MQLSEAAFPGAPVRAEELKYIIDCLRRGECCAVVGPSNTGKSFLLKSLPRPEVRQRCARPGAKAPIMVFVDCLEVGSSEQAFYELLLRRTIEELQASHAAAAILETLKNLHRELLHSANEVAVRSLYASSIRELTREKEMLIVFILDEFYDVFRALPPWPFRQLRALYSALEPQLCYVTATSHHLEHLRSDEETYEFRELFHLNTLMLHPLNEEDARRFMAYLLTRQDVIFSDENMSVFNEWAGGHPGLLERICTILCASATDLTALLQITLPELLSERAIQKECWRLWSELQTEQEALLTLVKRGASALNPRQRRLLEAKGLVSKKGDHLALFSSLFQAFIQENLVDRSQPETKGLWCDFETGQIWLDDDELTLKLSEPQRKLIYFLYQQAGAICTYDQVAHAVWGVGEGVSPGAIYELVKRVRQKIEPDWKNPHYIVTVPGKGYRLQTPE